MEEQGLNEHKHQMCPFCRAPNASMEELFERIKKRADANDPCAIRLIGCYYNNGGTRIHIFTLVGLILREEAWKWTRIKQSIILRSQP
mmetsp:Transcript_46239/g.97157  ORF Transcript_46239/g.97157 Transcript_46239/m.97157 type:complete len:88 (+) Transcript_46239:341-604(+)